MTALSYGIAPATRVAKMVLVMLELYKKHLHAVDCNLLFLKRYVYGGVSHTEVSRGLLTVQRREISQPLLIGCWIASLSHGRFF